MHELPCAALRVISAEDNRERLRDPSAALQAKGTASRSSPCAGSVAQGTAASATAGFPVLRRTLREWASTPPDS